MAIARPWLRPIFNTKHTKVTKGAKEAARLRFARSAFSFFVSFASFVTFVSARRRSGFRRRGLNLLEIPASAAVHGEELQGA